MFRTLFPLLLVGLACARPAPIETAAVPEGDGLEQAADAILKAFENTDPMLAGEEVIFRSNRDGNWFLYAASRRDPAASPRRLGAGTERIKAPKLTRDGKAVVYLQDRGADELYSIFRQELAGGAPIELTPGDRLERDPPFLPSAAPDTMVYSARSQGAPETLVYVQPVAGGAPRLAYRDPAAGGLSAVDGEAKRALLVRMHSLSRSELVLVDLVAGTGKKLFPLGDAEAQIHDAIFDAEGRVLVATDDDKEASLLLALDPNSGKEVARYNETAPATSTLSSLRLSPDGKRLALIVDAGNRHELRLLDAASLAVALPIAMPLGEGALGAFSADSKSLCVSWATSALPMDVFTLDVTSGALEPLRKDARPELDRLPALLTSIEEVPSFDGARVPVNVSRPASDKPLPVIVSFHGGPAASSKVSYSPFVRFYTAHGYAVVEPNIRGSTGFGRAWEKGDNLNKRLDAIEDMAAISSWVATQPWADPQRRIVMGGSYGGYLVLMALTRQPELWAAGIDLVGPSNWRSFMESTTGVIRQVLGEEFGTLERDGALLDSVSPLRDASKIQAPLFVYQGENDPRVPKAESDQVVAAVRAAGVPVEYQVAAEEGHSIDRHATRVEFLSRTVRFLRAHLE